MTSRLAAILWLAALAACGTPDQVVTIRDEAGRLGVGTVKRERPLLQTDPALEAPPDAATACTATAPNDEAGTVTCR